MKSNSRTKNRRSPVLGVAPMAVVAAGILGALALLNARRARLAERDHPPAGAFLEIEDVRVHYVERGKGPPLVLLHGNGAMIQDFVISGILDRLAERFRVIAIDRPGFGHTNRPSSRIWTAAKQAELVDKALARLGVEQAVVIGHSWGTLVALSLALDHPENVQTLVLLAGYYFPTVRADALAFSIPATPVIGDLLNGTIMPIIGRALRPLVFRRIFAPSVVSPRFSAEFPTELALRPSQIKASATDTELMAVSAAAIAGRYGELRMPVVVMAGRHDQIVDFEHHARRLAEAVPGATLLPFDDAGHMIHHDIPDMVVTAVDLLVAGPSEAEDDRALLGDGGAGSSRAAEPARSHPQT
jgi:pimeloyl-ACP methyl ester carboxylesterase